MQISEEEWKRLSHKQRRARINKERRRNQRQTVAKEREAEQAVLESQPGYWEQLAEEDKQREEKEQREDAKRLLEYEVWVERERLAQEDSRKKREREEKILREREERERLIREEWEALQQKEREEEERRARIRREKEERLKEALSTGEKPTVEPWHNPLAPDDAPDSNDYGTERDTRNCAFYLKTGACRFGDRCSKQHPASLSSTTLLIRGMYGHLGLSEHMLDERDHDAALEHDDSEIYEHFREFYDDVFPEFSKAGKIVQFKVSCNYEPHLRGNVYVQYSTEEECATAVRTFNARWYAQRQLTCEFCPVQRWKTAICGLFDRKRCPKGRHCNFLHVFRNPGRAFSWADKDLPPPHRRESDSHYYRRESRHRSRSRGRHYSRRRSRSRSRDRFHSRRRSRSRSRDRFRSRRSRSRSRDRFHSRRSRSRSRSRDRFHSRRSRSRSRSRSRDRHSRRRRQRKYDRRHSDYRRSQSRSRSRSKENNKDPDLGSESPKRREQSHSPSLSSISNTKDHSSRRKKQPENPVASCSPSRSPERDTLGKHPSHKKRKRKRTASLSPGGKQSQSGSPERKKHKKKHAHKHKKKKRHNEYDSDTELNDPEHREKGDHDLLYIDKGTALASLDIVNLAASADSITPETEGEGERVTPETDKGTALASLDVVETLNLAVSADAPETETEGVAVLCSQAGDGSHPIDSNANAADNQGGSETNSGGVNGGDNECTEGESDMAKESLGRQLGESLRVEGKS